MKKILSLILLLVIAFSLSSCHKITSSVRFVVDGEVVESYFGSSNNIQFPTPKEKDGMEFFGWLTDEYWADNLVTEENICEHFGFFPVLTLYAHYVVSEAPDNTPEAPIEPGVPEAPSEPESPNGNHDSNIDGDGWT